MNYTIQYKKSLSLEEPEKLFFEGNLTIHHIQFIKQEVEQKINNYKPLQIKVSNVAQLDLSFLQLLMALKKKYDRNATAISVHLELSQELEHYLLVAGFQDFASPNF